MLPLVTSVKCHLRRVLVKAYVKSLYCVSVSHSEPPNILSMCTVHTVYNLLYCMYSTICTYRENVVQYNAILYSMIQYIQYYTYEYVLFNTIHTSVSVGHACSHAAGFVRLRYSSSCASELLPSECSVLFCTLCVLYSTHTRTPFCTMCVKYCMNRTRMYGSGTPHSSSRI